MFVPVCDRPSVAELMGAQDRAVMETRSATIHRKMSTPTRQLPITESAHKARVVGNAAVGAVFARLDMTAERRCPAQLDRRHDPALDAAEMAVMGQAERSTVAAENIRHLQIGTHGTGSGGRYHRDGQTIERALRRSDRRGGHMGVACRRRQVIVTEQDLDDPDIHPALQQMGREAMA